MKTLIITISIIFCCMASHAQVNEVELSGNGIVVPRLDRTTIASPTQGQLVYDINSDSFWFHDGTNWVEIAAGGGDDLGDHTATQDVVLSGFKISNLASPVANNDAANKAYVLSQTVPLEADIVNLETSDDNLQDQIDDHVIADMDLSPTNEIETWSTLGGKPAGFADNTDNVDDADADPTNEIETWATLAGIPAGFADNIDNVNDADADASNELITGASLMGTDLQIMDAGGTTIVDLSSLSSSSDALIDADNDTKVQVEESPDDDVIRFDIEGSQVLAINKNANGDLLALPINSNTFIGQLNGFNNTGTSNSFIGGSTGNSNTSGANNTFIGSQAGSSNSIGSNNVYMGFRSGLNANGNSNVFIGKEAGFNESGSSKLYIDNTSTTTPLLWGDFDNDSLKIFGTLGIENEYNFPNTDGTANQIMSTDGSGNISWVNNQPAVSSLSDADTDTKIMVEESPDEDIIRFEVEGSELMRLSKSATEDSLNINAYLKTNGNKVLFGSTNEGYDGKLVIRNNSDYSNGSIRLLETGTHGARIFFQNTNVTNDSLWSLQGNSKDGWFGFFHRHPNDISSDTKFYINKSGRVQVNGNTPERMFHVEGDVIFKSNSTLTKPQLELTETELDSTRILFNNNQNTDSWMISAYTDGTNAGSEMGMHFDNGSGVVKVLKVNGNKTVTVNNVLNVEPRDTIPGSPNTGDIYMDDGTNSGGTPKLRYYNGTTWVNL